VRSLIQEIEEEKTMHPQEPETIHETVRTNYAEIARATLEASHAPSAPSCAPTGCCGARDVTALATRIGYEATDLGTLPAGANLGLSCGNPTAIASLTPGEIVLDLGSGGGFDVFLAGPKVGPTGRVIGVDMTPDMLALARKNTRGYHEQTGLENVEFRLGEIEHLPVADASVDVVLSNCVLNLSPDKPQVWREIARVLKPGGRVAVSDLALLQPLPPAVAEQVEALVGCVAGAALVADTERMMRDAGLVSVFLEPKPEYLQALNSANDPFYQNISGHLPAGTTPADYVTSLNITARKPL
jgi:arsenite methyltransferase